MKVCVLVPSEDALTQAGVRIRYGRTQPAFRARGHDLEVRPIDAFGSEQAFTHDAYIVSKVYDARSLVAADLLGRKGIPVGADLFDDYFTQADDTRLVRHQQWLRAFAPMARFMLCSTQTMQHVAQRYAPHAPAAVVNDPAPPCDPLAAAAAVERKLSLAHATGVLRVAWFGIGDNPYFPVGLHDLAHFGEALAGLRGHGFEIALSVLTNRRALTPEGLGMLSRLPVPFAVGEWSQAAEDLATSEALLAFLPVNAQPFSIAKSLNRAISCLATGTQILSPGYPLYEALGDLVYRDASSFMADLSADRLAIRRDTVSRLAEALHVWADPAIEAEHLASLVEAALAERRDRPLADDPFAIVLHGQASPRDVHRFSQALGALSASSPFCTHKLNFDVRCEFAEGAPGLAVRIAERWARNLPPDALSVLSEPEMIGDLPYRSVDLARIVGRLSVPARLAGNDTFAGAAAGYAQTMSAVTSVLRFLFPQAGIHVSEASRLPLRADAPAAAAA